MSELRVDVAEVVRLAQAAGYTKKTLPEVAAIVLYIVDGPERTTEDVRRRFLIGGRPSRFRPVKQVMGYTYRKLARMRDAGLLVERKGEAFVPAYSHRYGHAAQPRVANKTVQGRRAYWSVAECCLAQSVDPGPEHEEVSP